MLSILLLFFIFVIVIAIAVPLIVTKGNRKLTSDVAFQNVEYTGGSVLENFYDAPIQNPSWDEVLVRIRKMIDVLLTLKQATYGVRYMQAASAPGGYDLQVGLEEGNQTKLVDKIVSEQELIERFETFYRYGYVDNLGEFKPVQFYR